MARKETPKRSRKTRRDRRPSKSLSQNKTELKALFKWLLPMASLFAMGRFHGNIRWKPEQLVIQAIVWAFQESRSITEAFDRSVEDCLAMGWSDIAQTYPAFMNALGRYRQELLPVMLKRLQELGETVGGRFWRTDGWVLIGFDGSRASAPRSLSNERAFCAAKHGHGKTAKYRKKKSKGMRRRKNKQNPPAPPKPQVWITMMWHMALRLPWSWRIGASDSSERTHVIEMLRSEKFPRRTLFSGDAGFVGYPLWSQILKVNCHFLIRVGGNVNLLAKQADYERRGDGEVWCWPKDQMRCGGQPLRLRLVKVKIGKTQMWMLTSVLDKSELTHRQIVRYYKMRWLIEVEFRGLKQTLENHTLRSRNNERLLVELDWSIMAMAVAELFALGEQIAHRPKQSYDPVHRSLANTMRALRNCLRSPDAYPKPGEDLRSQLREAVVQKYNNKTDKKARFRPPNPDKKPLLDPEVRPMEPHERKKLREILSELAA